VEYNLDLVLALPDRLVALERGAAFYQGPAAPLLSDLEYRKSHAKSLDCFVASPLAMTTFTFWYCDGRSDILSSKTENGTGARKR
jgi:hypothetical protein